MPSKLQELRLDDIMVDQQWLCKIATDLPHLDTCFLDYVTLGGASTQAAQAARNLRSDFLFFTSSALWTTSKTFPFAALSSQRCQMQAQTLYTGNTALQEQTESAICIMIEDFMQVVVHYFLRTRSAVPSWTKPAILGLSAKPGAHECASACRSDSFDSPPSSRHHP